MNTSNVLRQALNLTVIVVVASVTSFLATRYYVQVITTQKITSSSTQTNADQNEGRDLRGIAQEEAEIKNRIQNSREMSGTVVEVGTDHIKIRPTSEVLGNCSDEVFISDYLRDRTVKVTADTRILKMEMPDKKGAATKLGTADIKNGDYVMVMSKENIGTLPEFVASLIQLPL